MSSLDPDGYDISLCSINFHLDIDFPAAGQALWERSCIHLVQASEVRLGTRKKDRELFATNHDTDL